MTITHLLDMSDLSLNCGGNDRYQVFSSDCQSSFPEQVGYLEWEKITKTWMLIPETGYAFSQVYISRIFSLLSQKMHNWWRD